MQITTTRTARHPLAALLLALSMSGLSMSVAADYEAGLTAAQNGDYDTALQEFTEAARDGLDLAQYNLGVMYYTGRGVKADHGKAFEWTHQAAEQGHQGAQFNLGVLYFNGHGTRRSASDAFQWYRAAAETGHAQAQYNVATMYRDGSGVERDPVQAHFWANVSRENEFADAAKLQEEIGKTLNEEQRAQANQQFVDWLLSR